VGAAAPLLGHGARLALAGDGPLREATRLLAGRLGAGAHVHFLGARSDVPDVLNALDAFALSSDTEGLPLVVPEAMATGLPVVCTAVGGLPTVVAEGRTGFLGAAGDERGLRQRLVTLRDDAALGRALGERGRADALERFSADRMHREYLALYERVLSSRRSPRAARDATS
jgi:glycosyltransferase involved in cell wall biosynthesis